MAAQQQNQVIYHGISVFPVDPSLTEMIRRHFSQYGEIASITFTSTSAFIGYINAASSNAAIRNSKQNIANNIPIVTVQVESYCPNVVNDKFNLKELCSVSDICKNCKNIAETMFVSRFAWLNISHWGISYKSTEDGKVEQDTSIEFNNNQRSNQDLKMLFQKFGHCIKSLCTEDASGYREDRVIKIFTLFAPKTTFELINLDVYNLNIKAQDVQEFTSKLIRLQSLKIRHVKRSQFVAIGELIQGCPSLMKLEVPCTMLSQLDQKIGKLENASFRSPDGGNIVIDEYSFEQFAKSNPQLKKLFIHVWSKTKSNVLRNIGLHLRELEDLHLGGACKGMHLTENDFVNQKKLKKFYTHCEGINPKEFFDVLAKGPVPIEELNLHGMTLNANSVKALTKLKTIKKIEMHRTKYMGGKIHFVINDEKLFVTLAKELPHLSHLEADMDCSLNKSQIMDIFMAAKELTYIWIESHGTVTTDDFMKIVNAVKNRNDSTQLKIDNISFRNIPKNVIEENRQWVEICRN